MSSALTRQRTPVRVSATIDIRPQASADDPARVDEIVGAFVAACGSGMLGGANVAPDEAAEPRLQRSARGTNVRYDIDAAGIEPASARVLDGMLRRDPYIALGVEVLGVEVAHGPPPRLVRRIENGRMMPVPALHSPLAFPVVRHEVARAKGSRLVRVRFASVVPDAFVRDLQLLQRTWQYLCAGGMATGSTALLDSSVLAADGYLVAPRTYEVPIHAFDVPEHAFHPLLNALHRCSVLERPIEQVQIW